MIVPCTNKIESIMKNKKIKKIIQAEDLIVNSFNKKILILQKKLEILNINYTQYFDHDSILQLKSTLLTIKSIRSSCPQCKDNVEINESISIGCDNCNIWYHLKCLNIKSVTCK